MKRRSFLTAASCAPVLGLAGPAQAAGNADDGTGSSGTFDIVAEFVGPGPSGVAVLPDGRMFVSFPRHADNHAGATLGEIRDGTVCCTLSLRSPEPTLGACARGPSHVGSWYRSRFRGAIMGDR